MYPEMTVISAHMAALGLTLNQQKANKYALFCCFRAWRKRVGVEPTIRPAKDRITGFEGRESHRTLFASGNSIVERCEESQGNVRSAGTQWQQLAGCGSEQRRGRRAQGWCRLRNRDAW